MQKILWSGLLVCVLAACGGGGGSSSEGSSTVVAAEGPTGASASSLANICTPTAEKSWVRNYMDEVYLWYNEITNVPQASYSNAIDYFYALRVPARDHFSFALTSAESALNKAGSDIGYGARFMRASDNRIRVGFVESNSPAAQNLLVRGSTIETIDGLPAATMDNKALNAALYPSTSGESHRFTVTDPATLLQRSVLMSAVVVVTAPVLQNQVLQLSNGKKLGYMVFNEHTTSAEAPLIAAFTQFASAQVNDLVLDIRYNGGGYLYIASEVAQMIAGNRVQGQVFDTLVFNAKQQVYATQANSQIPFYNTSTNNQRLPTLGLARVFVLTGPGTCSASEAIINGLAPFVQVITIGGTSCGKPYGFSEKDNCSSAYFAISFKGQNAVGTVVDTNGLAPQCSAADDLEHALGDPAERLLQTAIGYQSTGACPATTRSASAHDVLHEVYRTPWRNNQLLKN